MYKLIRRNFGFLTNKKFNKNFRTKNRIIFSFKKKTAYCNSLLKDITNYKDIPENFTFTENEGLTDIYQSIVSFIYNNKDSLIEKYKSNQGDIKESITYDGKVILFHTVLDLEVSSDTVIIGIYFPIIKNYHSITLSKDLDNSIFFKRRMEFVNFFISLLNPIDLYLSENSLYKKYSNLSNQLIIKLQKTSISKKIYSKRESNIVSDYLTLRDDNPIKIEINQSLDILIGSMLLTFNGLNYDTWIIKEILFYNSKEIKRDFLQYFHIQRNPDLENPTLCIESCYKKNNQIISNEKEDRLDDNGDDKSKPFFSYFSFSTNMRKMLIHFDVFQFLKKSSSMESLYFNKIKIFLNSQNKNFFPIECLPINKPITFDLFQNIKFIKLYNFNDLYFTSKTLLYSDVITHINSRFMFFKRFTLITSNFAMSLNKPDSSLGIECLEALEGSYLSITKDPIYKLQNSKININNLIYLFDYPLSKPVYQDKFKNVKNYTGLGKRNLYSDYSEDSSIIIEENEKISQDKTVTISNNQIRLGFGGLHSLGLISTNQKETTTKIQMIIPDEEHIIMDLDVVSFYVEIILKLLERTGKKSTFDFFFNLINIRNQLKKEKNPLQLVYKIIILAVTGQFNCERSPVYDPLLYFSMTANGQLIILEILKDLEESKLTTNLISCNTDGFTVEIKKADLSKFKELINKHENTFSIKFDTFDIIKKIMLFNVNKYIIIYQGEKEPKFKGFKKENFEFTRLVLLEILEQAESSKLNLDVVWEAFNKVYNNLNKLDRILLGYRSYGGEKKIFYFSSKPQSFGGISVGTQRSFYRNTEVYPVSEFNIQKEILNYIQEDGTVSIKITDIIEDICQNIPLSKSTYFKYVVNELIKSNLFSKELDFDLFTKQSNKDEFFKLIYSDYPIYKSLSYLLELGAFVQPKAAGKITLKNFKPSAINSQKQKDDYNNKLLTNSSLFLNACALSVKLEESFPNVIIIDVDHPDALFSENNSIYKGLLDLFNMCLEKNCLIFSSYTRQQVPRFKIMFKLQPEQSLNSYRLFKVSIERLIASHELDMRIETEGSVIGLNQPPWELRPLYENIFYGKDILCIKQKELIDLLSNKEISSPNELENFREILISSSGMSPENFNLFYTKMSSVKTFTINNLGNYSDEVLNNTRNKVQLKFDNKLKYIEKIIEQIHEDYLNIKYEDVENPLLSGTFNKMFKMEIWSSRKIPDVKVEETDLMKIKPVVTEEDLEKFEDRFEKSLNSVTSKSVINYSHSEVNFTKDRFIWSKFFCSYINSFLKQLGNSEFLKFQFILKEITYLDKDNQIITLDFRDKKLKFISSDLLEGNFKISRIEFSSPCALKNHNDDRIVSLLISSDYKIKINCFSTNCQKSMIYVRLSEDLSSSFVMLFLLADNRPFIEQNIGIYEYLMNQNELVNIGDKELIEGNNPSESSLPSELANTGGKELIEGNNPSESSLPSELANTGGKELIEGNNPSESSLPSNLANSETNLESSSEPLDNPSRTPLIEPLSSPLDSLLINPEDNPSRSSLFNPLSNPLDSPLSNPLDSPLSNPEDTPLSNPEDTPLGNPEDTLLISPEAKGLLKEPLEESSKGLIKNKPRRLRNRKNINVHQMNHSSYVEMCLESFPDFSNFEDPI